MRAMDKPHHVTGVLLLRIMVENYSGVDNWDRAFHGNKINFTSEMTMFRVAARIAYQQPDFETGGSVDQSHYDEEPA